MLQDNEIVMLLLGVGGLWFTLRYIKQLKRVLAWKWLIASFYSLLVAWVATIVEGYIFASALNFVEHLCYVISAVLFSVWCWQLYSSTKIKQK